MQFLNVLNPEDSNSDYVYDDHYERMPSEMPRTRLINKNNGRNRILELFTTIVHGLLLGFIVYMFVLCFNDEITLFSWHPAMLTVGWVFLMTEAILSLSGHNLITKSMTYNNRVRLHWALQASAVILIFIGFFVILINKNRLNKEHFVTNHGIFGLSSVICMLLVSVGGLAALFSIDLMKYIKPVIVKLIHGIGGILSFILGTISLILGIYSHWFEKKTTPLIQAICTFIILLTVCITLLKPIKTASSRLISVLR